MLVCKVKIKALEKQTQFSVIKDPSWRSSHVKVKLDDAEMMQKFVVKKISRSTNITISAEDQSLSQCGEHKPQMSEDLEVSSVKMCGYLKKKRNVSFINVAKFAIAKIVKQQRKSFELRWRKVGGRRPFMPDPLPRIAQCHCSDDWPICFQQLFSALAAGTNYISFFRTACWCPTTRRKSTRRNLCHSRTWFAWFRATQFCCRV